jgi:hypothetical protein
MAGLRGASFFNLLSAAALILLAFDFKEFNFIF